LNRADILIGIPSLNEADNIAFVTHQVALGLKRYFPGCTAMIINADNDSQDYTKENFLGADTFDIHKKYVSTENGVVGKGNNMRNLLFEARFLHAKVVVVVDADLRSITPEWIQMLASPIFKGYDYVTPLYSRNEYDGTITNHICYPLIYGLFNTDIRQSIGGEFAFSPRMTEHWLEMQWSEETRHYGIDIFMTTGAILNGFKVCQVVLGSKVHKPSAPKLGSMFTQVVATLFDHISRFKEIWIQKDCPKLCPTFGHPNYEEPQKLPVDYKTLKQESLQGFQEKAEVLAEILPSSHYNKLKAMYLEEKWNIGSALWLKILYEFVYAYEVSDTKKDIIEALKPLYFARVASFFKQTMDMSHLESEERIRRQARQFQKMKKYLINKFSR
jgi:glycosyltransferase involved in cell wall biosynthesis